MAKLNDKDVKAMVPPASGHRIVWDSDVKGFGLRITHKGARAFVLNYRTETGTERRLTIGSFGNWSVSRAREKARELRCDVDGGGDPMQDRRDKREAPDVNDLAARFEAEHLSAGRATTMVDYKSLLKLHILPRIGKLKVAAVGYADLAKLHSEVKKASGPYRANRAVAVVSSMMGLAIRWGLRSDNPAQGVKRAHEEKRERFLSAAEIARLEGAMASHKDTTACNALRLLLLTGARRGETLTARWEQFDLDAGVWKKPSAATKQGREHVVPLSGQAKALLTRMRAAADTTNPFVFPGSMGAMLPGMLRKAFLEVCEQAGLTGVRVHDLRHSFASMLASGGTPLLVVGKLMGHTKAETTFRYAHLSDDTLREAAERVGKFVENAGKPAADVVPLAKRAG